MAAPAATGELAAAVGRPGAARAVGAATGRNPLSILVPCHRLVGRDGALTGYAGGLERKRQSPPSRPPQGADALGATQGRLINN